MAGTGQEPTGSAALMRRINLGLILQALRTAGPQSRADLARATGLSKPTTNGLVEELARRGYVVPTSTAHDSTRPGRPAALYGFRADIAHVLGIDIGADKLLLAIADLDGTVLGKTRLDAQPMSGSSAHELAERLGVATGDLCQELNLDPATLRRAVVGTPGIVSPDGTLTKVPQFPHLEGPVLAGALEAALPCPVSLDREVHLSLMAEKWRGGAKDLRNVLYVQIGIGVGAGLLLNGEVFRGAAGAAGEIGLMPIGPADHRPEGEFGRFEWATGGAGLAARGRRLAATPAGADLLRRADGDTANIDAELLFTAATDGDKHADALVREAIATLATGIAALVTTLNPDTVILSGGLSRAGDQLLRPLQEYMTTSVPVMPDFVVSDLSDEAVALGAIRLALDQVEETLSTELEL